MARIVPVTVVETPEFLSATRKLMDEAKRMLLVDYLDCNPTAGDLIPGTGGFASSGGPWRGRGKRGGARVIYFHRNADMPLFALTACAKNERANLSRRNRNDFKRLTGLLVEASMRRHR